MKIYRSSKQLMEEAKRRKSRGERIGFVPTMGFLHEGHISLIRQARKSCDWLVISIYVNPLQFGPEEDLDRYPRDIEGDTESCRSAGCDALFLPEALYEVEHSTFIRVDALTSGLCGASRPGHFEGVTTVVARLFGIVQPDLAVFGEKDFQQLAVIRRMVRDMAMPIDVVGGALVRDRDGLALSSRNRYLTQKNRSRALSISQTLAAIRDFCQESTKPVKSHDLRRMARDRLQVDDLDYLEFVDPGTLEPLEEIDGPARAMVAAWVGNTRLIDNMDITP
jgi:pantoate--beta-alanine ligase